MQAFLGGVGFNRFAKAEFNAEAKSLLKENGHE
jgi:hypothetical protein